MAHPRHYSKTPGRSSAEEVAQANPTSRPILISGFHWRDLQPTEGAPRRKHLRASSLELTIWVGRHYSQCLRGFGLDRVSGPINRLSLQTPVSESADSKKALLRDQQPDELISKDH